MSTVSNILNGVERERINEAGYDFMAHPPALRFLWDHPDVKEALETLKSFIEGDKRAFSTDSPWMDARDRCVKNKESIPKIKNLDPASRARVNAIGSFSDEVVLRCKTQGVSEIEIWSRSCSLVYLYVVHKTGTGIEEDDEFRI
ncbi:hypothetical protein IMZ48_32170 [Candidatus Bathyarchaeota archaeon]|nr:hypothetical protein [Candidatus Bathyarchaeota archaeon]